VLALLIFILAKWVFSKVKALCALALLTFILAKWVGFLLVHYIVKCATCLLIIAPDRLTLLFVCDAAVWVFFLHLFVSLVGRAVAALKATNTPVDLSLIKKAHHFTAAVQTPVFLVTFASLVVDRMQVSFDAAVLQGDVLRHASPASLVQAAQLVLPMSPCCSTWRP
jgi:hypothetical protein